MIVRRVGGKVNIVFKFDCNWERYCGKSGTVLEKFWLDIIKVSQGGSPTQGSIL